MRAVIAALLLCVLCLDQCRELVTAKGVISSSGIGGRNEDEMKAILENYNREGSLLCNKMSLANWDVQTHVDDTTGQYAEAAVSFNNCGSTSYVIELYNRGRKKELIDTYVKNAKSNSPVEIQR